MLLRKIAMVVVLSLSSVVMLAGCGQPATDAGKAGKTAPDAGHAHDHPDEGPHHGHLVELGEEEFHAELVHDDAGGKLIVYLLDKAAKGAVAADNDDVKLSVLVGGQPKDFILKTTDSTKRDQFESTEKDLVEALDHDKQAKGRLHVSIGGKPFVGMIQHEKHGEHEHKD